MATETEAPDHNRHVTKEAKRAAIAQADDLATLDEMWAAWESRGWSRDGLMYAELLARKAELGHELDDQDAEVLKLAAARRKHGASLPPVTGKGR